MTENVNQARYDGRLEVRFSLTGDDYWNFNKRVYLASFFRRPRVGFPVILLFLFLLAALWLTNLPVTTILGVLTFFLVLGGASVSLRILAMKRRAARMVAANPLRFSDNLIAIDPNGVHVANPAGSSEASWRSFIRVEEDYDYIYLYRQPNMANIIPKRVFPSPQQAEQFMSAARTWWSEATNT